MYEPSTTYVKNYSVQCRLKYFLLAKHLLASCAAAGEAGRLGGM
jgi:hypothetical protein